MSSVAQTTVADLVRAKTDGYLEAVESLEKQRDALLAACKAAEYGANHVDCVSAMQHALPLIRAAIALTEQPK